MYHILVMTQLAGVRHACCTWAQVQSGRQYLKRMLKDTRVCLLWVARSPYGQAQAERVACALRTDQQALSGLLAISLPTRIARLGDRIHSLFDCLKGPQPMKKPLFAMSVQVFAETACVLKTVARLVAYVHEKMGIGGGALERVSLLYLATDVVHGGIKMVEQGGKCVAALSLPSRGAAYKVGKAVHHLLFLGFDLFTASVQLVHCLHEIRWWTLSQPLLDRLTHASFLTQILSSGVRLVGLAKLLRREVSASDPLHEEKRWALRVEIALEALVIAASLGLAGLLLADAAPAALLLLLQSSVKVFVNILRDIQGDATQYKPTPKPTMAMCL